MGLSDFMIPKGFTPGPGDTYTGATGTSYPMGGFQIFMRELMNDPMRVFDAYKRGQVAKAQPAPEAPVVAPVPVEPVAPVAPMEPTPPIVGGEPAPMGSSQLNEIRKGKKTRKEELEEIAKSI